MQDIRKNFMKLSRSIVLSFIVFAAIPMPALAEPSTAPARVVPTPIFNDPNYESAADPEIVWSAARKEWLIFYTARRIMADNNPGCGGCPIGVAASRELVEWRFLGYCKFDGVGGEKDADTTSWAPGVCIDDTGRFHMFKTHIPSAAGFWGEGGSSIHHYVAPANDPVNGWTTVGNVTNGKTAIDAGLIRDGGQWTMFYRDFSPAGGPPGSLFYATSPNLNEWTLQGLVGGDANVESVNGAKYQEAPYAFHWKGSNWLLTDVGPRLAQYRSDDLKTWRYQGPLLQNPGWRDLDKNSGKHPSVAVIGDRAFIVYFNHPYPAADKSPLEQKKAGRSWLHLSELKLVEGRLECDRDKLVEPPAAVAPASPNAGRD